MSSVKESKLPAAPAVKEKSLCEQLKAARAKHPPQPRRLTPAPAKAKASK